MCIWQLGKQNKTIEINPKNAPFHSTSLSTLFHASGTMLSLANSANASLSLAATFFCCKFYCERESTPLASNCTCVISNESSFVNVAILAENNMGVWLPFPENFASSTSVAVSSLSPLQETIRTTLPYWGKILVESQ